MEVINLVHIAQIIYCIYHTPKCAFGLLVALSQLLGIFINANNSQNLKPQKRKREKVTSLRNIVKKDIIISNQSIMCRDLESESGINI